MINSFDEAYDVIHNPNVEIILKSDVEPDGNVYQGLWATDDVTAKVLRTPKQAPKKLRYLDES